MNLKLPKKKPLNKYIRLSGVGMQMGLTIYLASYFGKKLDLHYGMEKKVFTLGLILFAFIASLYSILAQLKKIQDDK
ncbi:AtpZ/AtpI family protein [Bacteroidota bacterium]